MLEIDFRPAGRVAVLELSGEVNIDSSNFIEKVAWCLDNGYKDIICNFESVSIVDYAGLSVLAIAYKNISNHKGRIKFTSVPAHIVKVFSMVCLDRVFVMYDNEKEALKSFFDEEAISEIQQKLLRRRFKRLPLDIDVEFKSNVKEEEFYHGKILNISAIGLLVFAEKVYSLGEILRLKLKLLPKPGVIGLDAKVVWLVEKDLQPHIYPGMGLEFYKLDNSAQEKIVEFVERNFSSDTSENDAR